METDQQVLKKNVIHCPDCEKEYPKPHPGKYQCVQCFVKFTFEKDSSIKIIPFFDEMDYVPIFLMLGVTGFVLLVAMGDKLWEFSERLNIFLILVTVFLGGFKGANMLCRRYRGADRFFRRISRPRIQGDDESLIKLEHWSDESSGN